MGRARPATRDVGLGEAVLLSVEGISIAVPKPPAQPPRWLARVLPGVQWSEAGRREEDLEDDEDEEEGEARPAGVLKEVSFQLAAGEGLGLVGDLAATKTLLTLLAGLYPPSTGRIVIRGRAAPLLRFSELNFSGRTGKSSLKVVSNFLHWPPDFLRKRWDEIVDFAHLDEVEELGRQPGSVQYHTARTKRLFLSALMHLDASVYLVQKSFAGSDTAMFERCCDVLEQRQRDGCAILQQGEGPPGVARFCGEAILFEDGAPIFQGRMGPLATVIAERRAIEEQKRRQHFAVRALLVADEGEYPILGAAGGTIEIELDVFQDLAVRLALHFADEVGRDSSTVVDYPELFEVTPGIYRLGVRVPAGLLNDGPYAATLVATASPVEGDQGPPPSAELLSFEVSSQTDVELVPEFGVVDDGGEQADPEDVRWHVRRVEA
jgi:ABC-type polysaccharide/polyol phosphate transport system ATPase subunit